MSRRAQLLLAVAVLAGLGIWAWRVWWPDDERQIRRRLESFEETFNQGPSEGLGAVTRAARIAAYFTDDVVVELGQRTPPIRGRETLMGIVMRLLPRTEAFKLQLLDITTRLDTPSTADVSLTAAFRPRTVVTGESSIDAQELSLKVVKINGEWRVSHVTTVEPFR